MINRRLLTKRSNRLIGELGRGLSPKDFISKRLKELAELVVGYRDGAFQNKEFCEMVGVFSDVVEYIRDNFPSDYNLVNKSPYSDEEDCDDLMRNVLRNGYESIIGVFEDGGFIQKRMKTVREHNLLAKKLSSKRYIPNEPGVRVYSDLMFRILPEDQ